MGTGRVPYLELDAQAINFDLLNFKINSNGGDEGGGEGIEGVAKEHAGLAHARVPEHQELEMEVVPLLQRRRGLHLIYNSMKKRLSRSRAESASRQKTRLPTPSRWTEQELQSGPRGAGDAFDSCG